MQRIYVDTSVWVSAYGAESSGSQVLEWLVSCDLQTVVTSDWISAEYASALAMKRRRGELSENDWHQAHLEFDAINQQLMHLPINPVDYMKAASLCRDFKSNLRASDALHLAIALRHNCTAIFSLDNVLNQQAQRQGLQLISI
jgi:uncharacterized protein